MRRTGLPAAQLPDDALLVGYGAGDQEVAVAFVRRFQSRVYGVALAVLGDPRAAEDVAQAAFERAWRHARTYDPVRGSVATWLATITRNLAIDSARVRVPVPVPASADGAELAARVLGAGSPPPGPERAAEAGESAEVLRRALRELPPEQARAVVLAGIAGMSAQQVAEADSIPLGTAKTRIRTAMRRLREALVSVEVDDG